MEAIAIWLAVCAALAIAAIRQLATDRGRLVIRLALFKFIEAPFLILGGRRYDLAAVV